MKRILLAIACLMSAGFAVADQSLSPRQVLKMTESEVAAADEVVLRGIVVFVSGIEARRFVVAPEDQPKSTGVVVYEERGESVPALGDLVHAQGRIAWRTGGPILEASKVDVVRNETLAALGGTKQADFRRGLLENRRVALSGTAREVRHEMGKHGEVSLLSLQLDGYATVVRIPGHLDPTSYVGKPVRVTGLAVSHRGPAGDFLDAELEVAEEVDVIDLSPEVEAEALLRAAIVFGAFLLVIIVVLLCLWWHGRRVRHEMEVIAAERRRMAADLHDTIEQHLAGANLLAAGVMQLEDASEDVKEAMRVLAGLLANAKSEVRSAVLNLRSTGDAAKTLEETIGEMAAALAKTGVKTRRCLRGLPAALPEGTNQDIVLILREATTNAVKHGKASTIVFTSDPNAHGRFALRVLNDGAPFEVDRALGPETGHYGLSGMQERAIRNRLNISWGRDGRWTYVELKSEGRT